MRLAIAALALICSSAEAARPFVTDDARLVDPQGCQIETFYKRRREFRESELGLLPACNPWGRVELTFGGTWIDTQPGDSRNQILQGKTLLVPLQTNGAGLALTLGVARVSAFQSRSVSNPYVNGSASFSFLDDRVVLHANVGAVRDRQLDLTRGTWGIGAEVLLNAPSLYGIIETYGQRLEKPTLHGGVRIWIVPNRLQADATLGTQHATPFDRRFSTIGLRVLW